MLTGSDMPLPVASAAFSFQFSKRNRKKRITHAYPSERELILQFCRPSPYFFAVHNLIKFCFYGSDKPHKFGLLRAWKFSIRHTRFREEKSMKRRLKCTSVAPSKYHSNGSNNASEIDQNGPFHLKYFQHHKTIISFLLWKLELHRVVQQDIVWRK